MTREPEQWWNPPPDRRRQSTWWDLNTPNGRRTYRLVWIGAAGSFVAHVLALVLQVAT